MVHACNTECSQVWMLVLWGSLNAPMLPWSILGVVRWTMGSSHHKIITHLLHAHACHLIPQARENHIASMFQLSQLLEVAKGAEPVSEKEFQLFKRAMSEQVCILTSSAWRVVNISHMHGTIKKKIVFVESSMVSSLARLGSCMNWGVHAMFFVRFTAHVSMFVCFYVMEWWHEQIHAWTHTSQ